MRHIKESAVGNVATLLDCTFYSRRLYFQKKIVSNGFIPHSGASVLFSTEPVEKNKSVRAFTDETLIIVFSGLQAEGLFRRSANTQTVKDVQKLYNQGKLSRYHCQR